MTLRIRNRQDFWAGMLFIGLGALAIYIARDYPMGSAMRMGPGYFPTWIGAILIILGSMIAATSVKGEVEKIGGFAWRAVFFLGSAFAIFGWGIDHIGFIPSLTILISVSALAGKESSIKGIIGMCIVLITGSWALFIWGLELPFPLWWWR